MNSNNQSQNLATPSSGPLKTPEVIALYDCRLAFAVPGEDSLIDLVHPETGNSRIYSESLAEIRKRYPNAEIVNVDEFQAAKAARQNSPIEWTETTSERFNEMLGCLPPAMMTSDGFLVGEPYDHHALTGQPRYQAFVEVNQRFFTGSRPLTRKEFALVEALSDVLPLAEDYLRAAPSHPDNAKLADARDALALPRSTRRKESA